MLIWKPCGTHAFVSGRYEVRLERAGWVARVYRDGKEAHSFRAVSVARYAKELCEAVEVGLRLGDLLALDETVHVPLTEMPEITYEVVEAAS